MVYSRNLFQLFVTEIYFSDFFHYLDFNKKTLEEIAEIYPRNIF